MGQTHISSELSSLLMLNVDNNEKRCCHFSILKKRTCVHLTIKFVDLTQKMHFVKHTLTNFNMFQPNFIQIDFFYKKKRCSNLSKCAEMKPKPISRQQTYKLIPMKARNYELCNFVNHKYKAGQIVSNHIFIRFFFSDRKVDTVLFQSDSIYIHTDFDSSKLLPYLYVCLIQILITEDAF